EFRDDESNVLGAFGDLVHGQSFNCLSVTEAVYEATDPASSLEHVHVLDPRPSLGGFFEPPMNVADPWDDFYYLFALKNQFEVFGFFQRWMNWPKRDEVFSRVLHQACGLDFLSFTHFLYTSNFNRLRISAGFEVLSRGGGKSSGHVSGRSSFLSI